MGRIYEHNVQEYLQQFGLENYFETGTGRGSSLFHALQFPFQKYYAIDINAEFIRFIYNYFLIKSYGKACSASGSSVECDMSNQFIPKQIQLFIGKSTDVIQELLGQVSQMNPNFFVLDAHFPRIDFHQCSYEESVRPYNKDDVALSKMGPTLFFLDAHFPGAYLSTCSFEESIQRYKMDAIPLEREINLLLEHRDISKDVFIVDDLGVYEEEDYQAVTREQTRKYKGWLQEKCHLKISSDFLYDAFAATHDLKKDLRSHGYLIATPKRAH